MMAFGSVYCESLRGSILGVLYLYLWYNHVTSVSNGWVGALGCVVYLVLSGIDPITILVLFSRMVIKCQPMLS
jgi:hypothetical protein